MRVAPAPFAAPDSIKGGKYMETENSGITVLDEGVEESLEYANSCCKTGPQRVTVT